MVLEFKFARKSSDVKRLNVKDTVQLQYRAYTNGYELERRRIISAVLMADDARKKIIL